MDAQNRSNKQREPQILTRDEAVARLRRALETREEVLEAYLFGSMATGAASRHSDIDVAVFVDEARAPDTPFGYDAHLCSLLMKPMQNQRVDLVVLNYATPLLSHRVLRHGIRVCSRDLASTTIREGRAYSRYFDWIPQLAKVEAAQRRARHREAAS